MATVAVSTATVQVNPACAGFAPDLVSYHVVLGPSLCVRVRTACCVFADMHTCTCRAVHVSWLISMSMSQLCHKECATVL